jgi:hypothetical protein
MKANEITLQVIPATKDRPVTEANLSDLESKGQGLITYGIAVGDVIEMPSTEADIVLRSRPVRKNSTAMEYLLAVLKNGKPSWVSTGVFNRRNHKMEPVHEVAESLKDLENDAVRIKNLCGKTLKGDALVDCTRYKFTKDGERLDEIETVKVTALVYA